MMGPYIQPHLNSVLTAWLNKQDNVIKKGILLHVERGSKWSHFQHICVISGYISEITLTYSIE